MTVESIRSLLAHIKTAHNEAMPTGAQILLQSLLSCTEDVIEVGADNSASFVKEAVKAGNPGVSDDSLRKRIQFFNQYCADNDVGLKLKSRTRLLELEIDAQQFDWVAVQKMEALSQRIAKDFTGEGVVPPETPKPIVFISHKWHQDEALREIFHDFCQRLEQQLSKPPEGKPVIKLFYSTSKEHGFKPDSARQEQQDRWCQDAFLGLIFWSQFYDHSDACQCELTFFIDEAGDNQLGKKAIVLLDHGRLEDMPERLKERNAFFYPADNEISLVAYWEKSGSDEKLRYIAALCDKIHESYTNSVFALPPKSKKKRLDQQLIKAGAQQSADTLHDEKMQPPDAYEQQERIELIPVLTEWANNFGAKSTRVSVLLGDFGFGKTVSCRLLNKTLSEAYQADPTEALLPLYLDLKALQADIAEHKSKPIEHLLEAMLQKTGEKLTVSGEDIIQYIRANRCLVIFDGFDEIGHHLNQAEQQAVYASLLDIIPAEVYRSDAERLLAKPGCAADGGDFPSKLLISCRTHFFNKLSKEESFISGGTRHALGAQGVGLKNIRRFYMAPFSAETVEKYLCAVVGEEEGRRAKTMLGQIHDLSELSSHPIMLDLITHQLPQLQARQQSGKAVNSAVLYLNLFESIGERDTGKHKIRLSDKQELLAALALHLWRKQQSSISIKHLDEWFAEYAAQHRIIRHQLLVSNDAMQVLMQDLCNASLLVREEDRYRFVHTSYLEFFIALGLFECIRQHKTPDNFDALLADSEAELSQETLQFLLNWWEVAEAEDRARFNLRFRQLLESGSGLAVRQLGFALWKFGQLQDVGFPHSAKANWSGMTFHGAFIPDELNHLDYSDLNVRDCHFHLVRFNQLRLERADFADSRLNQVYFHHCKLGERQQDAIKMIDVFPKLETVSNANTQPALSTLQCLKCHSARVYTAVFSADDSRIVSGSGDGSVQVWSASSGDCLLTLNGHEGGVSSVASSANGARIISGSDDYSVKVWDASSGDCLLTLNGHEAIIWSVALSADGSRIVSGSDDRSVKVWNASSGDCVLTLNSDSGMVPSVAFSGDGSHIVSGSDDRGVKVWDASSGDCVLTLNGHEGSVLSVDFSGDGSRIVSGSSDHSVKMWNVSDGDCVLTLNGHEGEVSSVAFNGCGSRIVSGSDDRSVRVWDASSGDCVLTLNGHENTVWSAAFSMDGSRIVSGAVDCSVKVWDASSGDCLLTLLPDSGGTVAYRGSRQGGEIIALSGNAWEYCFAKDEQGNVLHPCQYEKWGEIYTP